MPRKKSRISLVKELQAVLVRLTDISASQFKAGELLFLWTQLLAQNEQGDLEQFEHKVAVMKDFLQSVQRRKESV